MRRLRGGRGSGGGTTPKKPPRRTGQAIANTSKTNNHKTISRPKQTEVFTTQSKNQNTRTMVRTPSGKFIARSGESSECSRLLLLLLLHLCLIARFHYFFLFIASSLIILVAASAQSTIGGALQAIKSIESSRRSCLLCARQPAPVGARRAGRLLQCSMPSLHMATHVWVHTHPWLTHRTPTPTETTNTSARASDPTQAAAKQPCRASASPQRRRHRSC